MLNFKRAGRGRKALIVLVLTLFGAILVHWAVTKWRSESRLPDRLDLVATVGPDDEFWLIKRVPGTHEWETNLLPRDQGVALLRAMETAQPLDYEVGYYDRPPTPLPTRAILRWCKGWENRNKFPANFLLINSRIESFNHDGKAYVVPAEGRDILDRIFSPEKEKETSKGKIGRPSRILR
jgi:hypothetical protein